VFTFIPDHCSESSRICVRQHPGIAFTFLRHPTGLSQTPDGLLAVALRHRSIAGSSVRSSSVKWALVSQRLRNG
jgi:hypothetical protein